MGKTQRKGNQSEGSDITPIFEPLLALQRLLTHFDNQGVIIGGIAASLLGKPRFTADLDAVILLSIEKLPELIHAAREQGITTRFADAESFAQKNRVLLLQHQDSGINIDLSLGMLPFEVEMVARSQEVTVGNLHLRLPSPEDLIILKAVAHRPQDLLDIQSVAASHPDLDKKRIQFWVEEFGEALEMPELWDTVAALL